MSPVGAQQPEIGRAVTTGETHAAHASAEAGRQAQLRRSRSANLPPGRAN